MCRLLAVLVAILIAVAGCESSGPTGPSRSPTVLNINQATVEDLEKLPGIGPKRARSIIASRNARGGRFTTLEELLQIDGIGETTLNTIRAHVVLGPPRDRP
jgi:competence protein ComEA